MLFNKGVFIIYRPITDIMSKFGFNWCFNFDRNVEIVMVSIAHAVGKPS